MVSSAVHGADAERLGVLSKVLPSSELGASLLVAIECVGGGRWCAGAEVATAAVAAASAATNLGVVVNMALLQQCNVHSSFILFVPIFLFHLDSSLIILASYDLDK